MKKLKLTLMGENMIAPRIQNGVTMSTYRNNLPFGNENYFITDAGLETSLVFDYGYDLPEFASFVLLDEEKGRQVLEKYFSNYAKLAKSYEQGLILDTPTWRASHGWGDKIGYDKREIEDINKRAVQFMIALRDKYNLSKPCLVSGAIGPVYDGYNPEKFITVQEAHDYHSHQIKILSQTSADIVTAFTITSIAEAVGICNAADENAMPVIISFTVETDGHLPSGETLKMAIEEVDRMANSKPVYYMINCAHPSHFENKLKGFDSWLTRIGGIRANASCKSHAELDESLELDSGDPVSLGVSYKRLKTKLSGLRTIGGCCGTDHKHVGLMCSNFFD
jgi:S-methylmethionine-dependent homocysteine/selenocysteine methylase